MGKAELKTKKLQKVRKAVFPVAGFGSRFLPATKAMPKELLPIVDKPLIQYAAEEAIDAGIDTLIFITGRHKRAIEDHFDRNKELEDLLLASGKKRESEMVKNILPKGIECIFIRQSEQLGLGHAVSCAKRVVGDEPFAVLLADEFLLPNKKGVTAELVEAYEKTGKSQLAVMTVNDYDVESYGILAPGKRSGTVEGLIEKPSIQQAPSNLASIGRYILLPEIFKILLSQKPGKGGEIQLADAINSHAKLGSVFYKKINAKRFDCGSIKGYTDAILHFTESHYE